MITASLSRKYTYLVKHLNPRVHLSLLSHHSSNRDYTGRAKAVG